MRQHRGFYEEEELNVESKVTSPTGFTNKTPKIVTSGEFLVLVYVFLLLSLIV